MDDDNYATDDDDDDNDDDNIDDDDDENVNGVLASFAGQYRHQAKARVTCNLFSL